MSAGTHIVRDAARGLATPRDGHTAPGCRCGSESRDPGGKGTGRAPSRCSADLSPAEAALAAQAGDVSFTHELRNISSCIRAYAQLLLSMNDDGRMLEYLGIMEAGSRRCCNLIDRALKPTSPASVAGASGSDAGLVVERVCELVRGEAILRGVKLVREVDDRLPPASIPREDLEGVLLDLVLNAIQATGRGGSVEVRARECRLGAGTTGIEITVADTGRGIPEYARGMIFEPFFSTRAPGDGSGLGLGRDRVAHHDCARGPR